MDKKLFTNINKRQLEMLERIMKDNGLFSISETVRFCISYTYKKEIPPYLEIQKDRLAAKLTPEERAQEQVAMRELREEVKSNKSTKKKAVICEILEGVQTEVNNQLHCTYKLYTEVPGKEVEAIEITEPFDTLSEDSVKLQYRDLLGNTGGVVRKKLRNILDSK